MVNATHTSFTASDRSYYSILKKEIHNKAAEAGFEPNRIAEIDIIVAEMTSNLHKYAVDGEILAGLLTEGNDQYIEIISIDNGPGMADPTRMMSDGYSSTNTMGHGLGSIKRLADKFELYSIKDWGTILLCRVYKKQKKKITVAPGINVKGIVVSKPGESFSGDGYYYSVDSDQLRMFVADGLGHGLDANLAMNEGIKAFKACDYDSPAEMLRQMHQAVRKTRGMVGTVAFFNFATREWKLCGIGNIAAKLLSPAGTRNHVAYNGIIGHNIPNTLNDQHLSANDYQQIIFCSDGIKSRWDLAKYPQINRYDLTILASAIYKDFARRTDDMSVVVIKLVK